MRQAGRSLPEYRALRAHHDMLEMCRTPDLAAEVTLQPVRRYGVDAAILFSDIVLPLQAMGISVEIKEGIGPVVADPIRSAADVQRLHRLEPEDEAPYVLEAIQILCSDLDVPLIGFAGAPFTLACYLIDGAPSRTHADTKALMFSQPDVWSGLMDLLADSIAAFLRAQVAAGVKAVQLFDSWVGVLSPDDYQRYAMPFSQKVLAALGGLGVPRIHFGVGTAALLELMVPQTDVIGIDWTTPLDDARASFDGKVAVQGNLDPALCLAPWGVLEGRAREVLERGGGRGHIFNLGHGVLPQTEPDNLARLVDLVKGWHPE